MTLFLLPACDQTSLQVLKKGRSRLEVHVYTSPVDLLLGVRPRVRRTTGGVSGGWEEGRDRGRGKGGTRGRGGS